MSSSPDPVLFAGPMLLGYLFNWSLYGFEISQLHTYRISFPKERIGHSWTARLVYAIFLLDTIQIIMTTQHAWYALIAGWGNTWALYKPGRSWIAVPLFTSIISCLVQLYYARRIKGLRVSGWIVFLICALSVFQAVSGIIFAVQMQILADFSRLREIATTITLWLCSEGLCDLLITSTVVTFLAVNITGFEQTDSMTSKVMKTTVETGMATTGMTILHLVLFLAYPGNNLHMIASIPLSKVYSVTLLAMLNARQSKFSLDPQPSSKQSASDLEALDPHKLSFGKNSPMRLQNGLQTIRIKQSKEMLRDDGTGTGVAPAPVSASGSSPFPSPVPVPVATIPITPPAFSPTKPVRALPALPPLTYSNSTFASYRQSDGRENGSTFEREWPTRAQANADFDSAFVPVAVDRPVSPRWSHLDLGEDETANGTGKRPVQKHAKRI